VQGVGCRVKGVGCRVSDPVLLPVAHRRGHAVREKRLHSPFALHAPKQWAMQGCVIKERGVVHRMCWGGFDPVLLPIAHRRGHAVGTHLRAAPREDKVYEPQIRALIGTAAHFCEVVVLTLFFFP